MCCQCDGRDAKREAVHKFGKKPCLVQGLAATAPLSTMAASVLK